MAKTDAPPTLTTRVPGLPPRPDTMHKGQAGCVALIAGSRGMSGAAILAGLGALRGGAGLVRVCCPESIQSVVAASDPCFVTVGLPEIRGGTLGLRAAKAVSESLQWADVVAVGPGLRHAEGPAKFLATLSADPQFQATPAVFDADALNVIAGITPEGTSADEPPDLRSMLQRPWWEARVDRPTIVTPHPGEMARLRRGAGLADLHGNDDETRLRIAHEFATWAGVTVVLKGHRTIVCTPEQAYVNTTGNAGMATGGMGDVLTGLIAALLAQGLNAFDAARLGVYCHGWAADQCAKQIAPVGYLAREVADHLPAALVAASQPTMGFKP